MPHRKKQTHFQEEFDGQPIEATDPEPRMEDEIPLAATRVEQLEKELEAANNERLRAIADFQNYRRRNEEEKATYRRLATESFVSDLLPVLDNFERTVQHFQAGTDSEKMMQGIQAVEKQLRRVLEGQNVRRIEAAGQPFDPALHEAVATETSEEFSHDTVMLELEPGYRIGDKVIRPARVKVAKSE